MNHAPSTSIQSNKSLAIIGITVSFFISIPWLALLYAGQQIARLPLLPFEFFEILTRYLPGSVVTLSIEWMIQVITTLQLGQTSETGKNIEIGIAYLLTLVIMSGLGGLYVLTIQRLRINWAICGLLAGLVLTIPTLLVCWGGWGKSGYLVDLSWLLVTSMVWGLGLAWGINHYIKTISLERNASRKRFLGELAIGSLVLTGLTISLGRWLIPKPKPTQIAIDPRTPEPTTLPPTPPPTKAGFEPIPGTRPEITPIENFYRVDINILPPGEGEFSDSSDPLVQRLLAQGGETDLPAETYILVVDGLVKTPLALSLADIKSYSMVEQYATLECISNPVGGDLISTTLFQGARLKDILDEAGFDQRAVDIKFTCVDGYSESLPVESALHPETLLCYSMGNKPLTQVHGAPLRLFTPNRFGIKNPKWIIKIEAVDSDYQGYWQKRGWSESSLVKITSVIDIIKIGTANQSQVGGIAYAGTRGIQAVELSVDESPWIPTELSRPLSPNTWVLWRAFIDLPTGEHQITVRAIDGDGEVQTSKRAASHPSGATGYHSKMITI
jgi:hypothetical protein